VVTGVRVSNCTPAEAVDGLAVTPGTGDFRTFPGTIAVSDILAPLPDCLAAGCFTNDSFVFFVFPFVIVFPIRCPYPKNGT